MTESLQNYFDSIAPKRDYWKKKNSYYYNYIEKFIKLLIPPNRTVLEIGCGTGDLLAKLEPSRGIGIDISSKIIGAAKQKYQEKKLEFKAVDICQQKLSAPNISHDRFDFIVLSDVISYLSDVENAFVNITRFTTPKSRIIITQHSHLWQPLLELGSKLGLRTPLIKQNWLSVSDIENLLYLTGFEIIKRGPKLLFPKYFPVLSGFLNSFLTNIFPFNKLAFVNYIIARPVPVVDKDKNYSVSIIIPARNEAQMIEKLAYDLPTMGNKTELIFIENNSTDNTLEILEKTAKNYHGKNTLKFFSKKCRGKKEAVYSGFDMASGDILMIYDADMTVPAEELEKFYYAIVNGKGEFINGSRLVYPMERQSMQTFNIIGNKFFSLAFSWLLGQKIKDTLCGTKVLWKNDFKHIKADGQFFGNFDLWGDFDLLFGASKLNLKIIDLPIHYKERTYGVSNMRRWKHGWMLLKMVILASKKIKFI